MLKCISSAFFASALLISADCTTANAQSKPPDLPLNTKETYVPQCPAGMDHSTLQGWFASVQTAPSVDGKEAQQPAPKTWSDNLSDWFDENFGPVFAAWMPGVLDAWGTVQDRFVDSLGGIFANPYQVAGQPAVERTDGGIAPRSDGDTKWVEIGRVMAPANSQEVLTYDAGTNTIGLPPGFYVIGSEQPLDAEAFKAHAAKRFCEIAQECEFKGDTAMARNCYEEAIRVCPDSEYAKLASANSPAPACQRSPAIPNHGCSAASKPRSRRRKPPPPSISWRRPAFRNRSRCWSLASTMNAPATWTMPIAAIKTRTSSARRAPTAGRRCSS